jgi:hypothetical protein
MATCVECRFFHADGFGSGDNRGLCIHRSPAAHYHQLDKPDGDRVAKAIWPVVDKDHPECGDYKVMIPGV